MSQADFNLDMEAAMAETCRIFDRNFLDEGLMGGSTAIGVFIDPSTGKLVLFNIGDSRAVLCRNRTAVELNVEHKPNSAGEEGRILAANGWLDFENVLQVNRVFNMHFNQEELEELSAQMVANTTMTLLHRIVGDLAVSRTFGDSQYKRLDPTEKYTSGDWEFILFPDDHNRHFNADLIIVEPDFQCEMLSQGDEFLLLASDGLWDVLSSELVVRRVRGQLVEEKLSPDEVAESLCGLARRLGSNDDITVVIVQFMYNS